MSGRCPDDGTCHHSCALGGPCFRVLACEPLSGVYPGDRWPAAVREEHGKPTQLSDRVQWLIDALEFYAYPGTYHAIFIWADPPAGDFMDDFSEDHGDSFYQRPMPGKLARETLAKWSSDD